LIEDRPTNNKYPNPTPFLLRDRFHQNGNLAPYLSYNRPQKQSKGVDNEENPMIRGIYTEADVAAPSPTSSSKHNSTTSTTDLILLKQDHLKMAPAELPLSEEVTPPAQVKGYHGRNMTLPASWWNSTSLFQLERRAIFAKVPTRSTLTHQNRHGYMQLMPLISKKPDRIEP
jgi:hypothetical protein